MPGSNDISIDAFDMLYATDSLKLPGCSTHTCMHAGCKRRRALADRRYFNESSVRMPFDCDRTLEMEASKWQRSVEREKSVEAIATVKREIGENETSDRNQTYHGFASSSFAYLFDAESLKTADTLPRIPINSLSRRDFMLTYETGSRPVMLVGLDDFFLDSSKRSTPWTCKGFLATYGKDMFKVGVTSTGDAIPVRLSDFLHYVARDCDGDDNPMYLFDDMLEQREPIDELLHMYRIPHVFADDLLAYGRDEFDETTHTNETLRELSKFNAGDAFAELHGEPRQPQLVRRRHTVKSQPTTPRAPAPPHRWLVMGARRSGTALHKDPLSTCAWNTLLHGWCLFPPSTPVDLITPPSSATDHGQSTDSPYGRHSAIEWFARMHQRMRQGEWPEEYRPIEVLQSPGETIFVPSGWWHVVLNVSKMTIAITQNLCMEANLYAVMTEAEEKRPDFAKFWREQLGRHRPICKLIIMGKYDQLLHDTELSSF